METIYINSQSYEVHEEVAEQFSKFIRRANDSKQRIKALEESLDEISCFLVENTDFQQFQLVKNWGMRSETLLHNKEK